MGSASSLFLSAFNKDKKTLVLEKNKMSALIEEKPKGDDEGSVLSTDEDMYYSNSECSILSESDDDYMGEENEEMNEYFLKEKLGKGGFGIVWGAIDKQDKWYALKIGKKGEDTKREVDALQTLGKNEHTIDMLNYFWHATPTNEKHLVLVFPRYNSDLEDYIQKCEGMSLKEVQRVFPKILKGVQHIHEHQITHTDLKPNNILINVDDEYRITDLVITDFGCCSWDGAVCKYGKTSCYRSVNIILNEAASPEDDIWSLGCILFEMFTNQYLFDPDIPEETSDDETSDDETSEDGESSEDDADEKDYEVNRMHLMLMLEILGPFPRKLALKHRTHFNAKGTLKGNPKFNKLDMGVIFKEESCLAEEYIPMVCRLVYSMMKYTKRQRALISEIMDDPLFQ
jgi:serine/threonine protein kinase